MGVHIADVAHFVAAGTALDTEAAERGTSVYMVDRVIPMLPRLLCEELCSLNPGEAFGTCLGHDQLVCVGTSLVAQYCVRSIRLVQCGV